VARNSAKSSLSLALKGSDVVLYPSTLGKVLNKGQLFTTTGNSTSSIATVAGGSEPATISGNAVTGSGSVDLTIGSACTLTDSCTVQCQYGGNATVDHGGTYVENDAFYSYECGDTYVWCQVCNSTACAERNLLCTNDAR
jgi:hypothetical protein